jgi:CCR4-NOT transcription complex subunit 7/8
MAQLSTASFHQAGPVRSVWAHNLEHEFTLIRQFTQSYPFAMIDTEFPGVVHEAPKHPRHMSPHERYALVKRNVDCLKLIQLGLILCTSDSGDGAFTTWEFNFRGFNPLQDPHASSSIQLLESQGMNLWMNYDHGIDPQQFRCLMLSSGLLFNPSRIWIGFHLAYDIAYLLDKLVAL